MKKVLFLAAAAALLMSATAFAGNPHGNPPGNDGQLCHGHNQASCRPDPQPSHGQDCQPHGNNPDGNDDHCASTAPSEQPSEQPSEEPSEAPSTSPTESQPTVDTGGGQPDMTPPPTDTAVSTSSSSNTFGFLALILIGSFSTYVVLSKIRQR
jgi:hypothetical protein